MTVQRILYLLRYFPTLTETFVYEEIKSLQARGHNISIASMGSRADGKLSDRLPQVDVLSIPRRPLKGRLSRRGAGEEWIRQHQRSKDAARFSWLVQNARNRFDHVHVHFAGEAAELAHALFLEIGIPYTVMVHATDLFRPRPSMAEVLSNAHKVLTICTHHQDYLADLGIPASVVRCGPDLNRWQPSPLPSGPVRALTVARDVPKKGLNDLLNAWESVPNDSTLMLVSDIHRPQYPDGIQVIGLQAPSEIQRLMTECNLFILPCRKASDGDMDGVPVALMEALACGRPVITTPVSGIPELVDEKVGWMVPPNRPDLLIEAIRSAQDPAERLRRGQQGRNRLKERGFTLHAQVSGLLENWEKS